MLLAEETLNIFLETGISKRNILFKKKEINVFLLIATFMKSLLLQTEYANSKLKKNRHYIMGCPNNKVE